MAGNRRLDAVSFVMYRGLLGFVLLALSCRSSTPVPLENPPQDVVLLMLCTARADQFSSWGGPAEATPFLAESFAGGARFERTVAQAPWTRPASVAITTGRHPAEVGMVEPGSGRNNRVLPSGALTLAERLSQRGFQTIGLTANPNLNAHFGFNQGFDQYLETSPLMRDGGTKVYAPYVGRRLAETITAAEPTKPLFVQAMLVDAHRPFKVDSQLLSVFSDPSVSRDVTAYRASLRRMDNGLREMIQAMVAARPGLGSAIWVVVGDHGEALSHPEHHGTSHGTTLYPSVTHVPWGMWGPGIPAGAVVKGLTAQVDVAPTVLGVLGYPDATLEGIDHSGMVRAGGGDSVRRFAFSGTWFRWSKRAARFESHRMCQMDFNKQATRRQLSRSKPATGLFAFPDGCFDFSSDPTQSTPLLDGSADADLRMWFATQERLNEGMGGSRVEDVPDQIDAQLKALGYAE